MACIAKIRALCAMLPVFPIVTIQAFHLAFFWASLDKNKQKMWNCIKPYGDALTFVLKSQCILYGFMQFHIL